MNVPLTVLMPAFNAERYVGETIESVLAQSYRDFEFLIVNDGSSDGTARVLASYAGRDARIRVLSHANQGVGRTIDRGLNEARGDLIAIIEADDVMLPGRLEKQVAFMNEHLDYVVVGGYLRIIDPDGRAIGLRRYPTTDDALRARIVMYDPLGHPSLMFRRAEALACGSYTARFWTGSDYDFLLRLAQRGRMANLPEPLTAYRFHPNSIKSQRTLEQLRETLRIKRVAYEEYGYAESPLAKAVNFGQTVLTRLPGGFVYWLFTRLFIRRPDASAGG